MYLSNCPYVLHRGEILQTRRNKFSNKQTKSETEKISVWHRAKKKDGENGQRTKYQELSQQVCEDQQIKP